jgi:hypothetical protein
MTTEDYLKDKLKDLAREIDGQIPMEHGFVLLVFPFGPNGILQYIANCHRADVAQAMREWIALVQGEQFGTDQGESEKEMFGAWLESEKERIKTRGTPPSVEEFAYDAFVAGMAYQQELAS